MRRTLPFLFVLLGSVSAVHAKPSAARSVDRAPNPRPRVWAPPAPPLPMLPRIARVRLEAARDHVVVVEEIHLPRGDWQSGGLDVYVAFGAPGTPMAVDARLLAVPVGSLEPRDDDPGDAASVEPGVRHAADTQLVLGRPQMAGVVVRVKDSALRQAYGVSDLATLRVRSLLAPPAVGAQGERDVVVRLGVAGGSPLTLGQLQVVSLENEASIARAEASLCGPDADPWPLSVAVAPKAPGAPRPLAVLPIAPSMAVRHGSDDLCIRWWTSP
jgi:hypothetical protein